MDKRRSRAFRQTTYNTLRGVKKDELHKQTWYYINNMTVEQIYSEVLYECLHGLGCDAAEYLEKQEQVFQFLMEAFGFDQEKHEDLLAQARLKEAPDIILNVEVIDAKELRSKDCNGLSDPFCTLYLSSTPTQRYNTSVKSETLCPVWEEHFSLPVDNPAEETLVLEIWDFDPAESVREKLGKFGDVKGVRGLKKLMKEIAITASTGKHNNELVGVTHYPLKDIPVTGRTQWLPLEKRGKSKIQGHVQLRVALSAFKNCQVATQEHRHLLKLLLEHDLKDSEILPYQWEGNFSELAEQVLSQHRAQTSLTPQHEALACWAEFCAIQSDHPLSFRLFGRLLEKLSRPISNGSFNEEEVKVFWESAKKILPLCLNCIRKIRRLTPSDKATLEQLTALLSVLAQLRLLSPPPGVELFPASMFGWLTPPKDGQLNCDITQAIQDAVEQGAKDWFDHAVDGSNNNNDEKNDEDGLSDLVCLVSLIHSDMLRSIEFHEKIYVEVLQFPYAKMCYAIYDKRIAEKAEYAVAETCSKLKPLKFNEGPEQGIYDNEPVTMGTSLFELYLSLQRFAMLGLSLCPGEDLAIQVFHTWFHRGVAQWLDIALYKALKRVQKAVELDVLDPVDASVKFSSSAVDTLSIYYQIKIFWKELNWPDVESAYSFIAKIIDDICRCSVFYADQMSQKVSGMGETEDVYSRKFEVTNEWCVAINNIEYVRQSIKPFVQELELKELIDKLADFRSPSDAKRCQETLELVIENAVENVGNKIVELVEVLAEKMAPAMQRFLQEGAELLHQENMSLDRLMGYLDSSLATLHHELSPENSKRTRDIIWEGLTFQLSQLVASSLEKRRPPLFYARLLESLTVLEGFFHHEDEVDGATPGGDNAELLSATKASLRLYGLETRELVHQYHLERLEQQKENLNNPAEAPAACCGFITVRFLFVDTELKIEVLNARNLKPADSNGMCDPYVKIHLLPEERFLGSIKPKTKVHSKNLFPLFDENFVISLSDKQCNEADSLVHLVLKDYDMLGSNELVGEAFVSFGSIRKVAASNNTNLHDLPQLHLPLTRPTNGESTAFKALELRLGDKMAKEFLKKERAKFPK